MEKTMRILIPTDFSDNSHVAIQYAINLFSFQKLEITLLHAYKLKHYGSVMTTDLDDLLEHESRSSMKKLVKSVNLEFPDVTIHSHVEQGFLIRAIDNIHSKQKFDLLAMGTKGKSDVSDVLFGSNAVQVIKYIEIQKLVVPSDTKMYRPNNILFAKDEDNFNDASFYSTLIDLCQHFNSKLHILNLCNSKEHCKVQAEKDGANNAFSLIPHEFYYRMQNEISEGILNFAETSQLDMICLVQKQYTFLQSLFHKSVTKKMALNTNIPLFILQE